MTDKEHKIEWVKTKINEDFYYMEKNTFKEYAIGVIRNLQMQINELRTQLDELDGNK